MVSTREKGESSGLSGVSFPNPVVTITATIEKNGPLPEEVILSLHCYPSTHRRYTLGVSFPVVFLRGVSGRFDDLSDQFVGEGVE